MLLRRNFSKNIFRQQYTGRKIPMNNFYSQRLFLTTDTKNSQSNEQQESHKISFEFDMAKINNFTKEKIIGCPRDVTYTEYFSMDGSELKFLYVHRLMPRVLFASAVGLMCAFIPGNYVPDVGDIAFTTTMVVSWGVVISYIPPLFVLTCGIGVIGTGIFLFSSSIYWIKKIKKQIHKRR